MSGINATWLDEYRATLERVGVNWFTWCIVDDLSPEEMGVADDPPLLRRHVRTNGKSGPNCEAAQRVINVPNFGGVEPVG